MVLGLNSNKMKNPEVDSAKSSGRWKPMGSYEECGGSGVKL